MNGRIAHLLRALWRGGPRGMGVLSLMMLVIGCGAMWRLARLGWENRDLDRFTVQNALGAFRSQDASERSSAARDLARFGPAASDLAVPALISALADPDATVRGEVAAALGQVAVDPRDAGAAAIALRRALKDVDPTVRIVSANALSTMASARPAGGWPPQEAARTLDALAESLDDRNPGVRVAALYALAVVGPGAGVVPLAPLVSGLDDPSEEVRAAAISAAARIKEGLDPLVPVLLQSLVRAGPHTRSVCLRALSGVQPPAITAAALPSLTEALQVPDREVQCAVMYLIARLGPDARATIPALNRILATSIDGDPVPTSRPDTGRAAAWALGELAPGTDREDEVIATLIEFLSRGHPKRRDSAADALGRFSRRAETAIPALIAGLRASQGSEASYNEGASIAAALGKIAPGTSQADETVAALIAALDARSLESRWEAIRALAPFGPAALPALPSLRKLASDPNPQLRALASAAVQRVQPAPAETATARSPE